MLQRRLFLSLFISLGIILSVSGTPAPPPMQHVPVQTTSGLRHSWQAWEPDAKFSSLREYAKAAYEEASEEATLHTSQILIKDRPCTVASLWVKNKGIYSASDLGYDANNMKAPLHPKTQALCGKCSADPNRSGGYCSCIQAIDGFHKKFPNDDIPKGSQMAIYGTRDKNRYALKKLRRPCRADDRGSGCAGLLSAAGIEYQIDPSSNRGSNSHKRPLSETGSIISRPRGRPSLPKVPPHLDFPYVSSDESLSVSE